MRLDRFVRPELVAKESGSTRYFTREPWFHGEHVCATDGSMALRVPVDPDPDHDEAGVIPGAALVAMRHAAAPGDLEFLANGQVVGHGCSFARRMPKGELFAPLSTVIPEHSEDAHSIRLDARRLFTLAQAMGTDLVRIQFSSAGDPIRVEPAIDNDKHPGIDGALMPVEIQESFDGK